MSKQLKSLIDTNVLELIWDNTTDGIFTIGYTGAIINANPALENLLGWKVEEIKGIAFPPFFSNMTKEEQLRLIQKLQDGQNLPYEIMKRKHKDGTELDILASYRAINKGEILAVAMYKDFTEQMKIQQKLLESEYCYRMLIEYLPETIIKLQHGEIDVINSSGMHLFGGKSQDEIIGHSIWNFISSDHKDMIQKTIDTVYEKDERNHPEPIVTKIVRLDGKEFWTEIKVIPIGSKEEQDIQIVIQDITEKKKHESQLQFLAYHDPLTGLKNRRIFTEIVTDSIEEARKAKGKLAIMYIDIDKFKLINDMLGHDVGDTLLQKFADRLRASVRDNDEICRIGGDEFLVLLKDIKNEKQITAIAKRMYGIFQESYQINEHVIDVTASVGISIFPEDGLKGKTLIHRADKALYQAKENRNKFMFYVQ